MTFTNPDPSVSVILKEKGRTVWRLNKPYWYHWQYDGRWYRFFIPAGFEYDGASVPWFLRWVATRDRFGLLAPLVHDWLHHKKGEIWVSQITGVGDLVFRDATFWTRRQADRLFFRILREQGVKPRWLRRGAFRMVRLWSWMNGDKWR